jgi:hypothetical protein
MKLHLTFVFRLNHKQMLKTFICMTMKLLVDNNKTIIDLGIDCFLVYQHLKTYIHIFSG